MAAPCRKCGATKTEPVRRGLRPTLAKRFGYDLRKCARCRKLRLISRRPVAAPGGSGANSPEAAPSLAAGVSPGVEPAYDPDGFNGCPRCGERKYYRSARSWFERVVLRHPPMARCTQCRYRFPIPQA